MKKNKFRAFVLVIFLVAICAFFAHNYLYKPHQNIETILPDFTGKTDAFKEKYSSDYTVLFTKTVELSGIVVSLENGGFILDESIYCQLKDSTKKPVKGQLVTVKGIVIGYDDLLNELKLKACILK